MNLGIPETSLIEFGKFCAKEFSSNQLTSFLKSKGITIVILPEIASSKKLKYKIRVFQLNETYCEYMLSNWQWLKRSYIGNWSEKDILNETLFDSEEFAFNCSFDCALVLLEKENL